MSYLVAIVFDNLEEAGKLRRSLRSGEHLGTIHLEDSAVIVCDQDGKPHIKDEVDKSIKVGTLGGSFIGLVISGLFFFPIVPISLGALSGAALGKLLGDHIDKQFIAYVIEALKPNTSAIFFIFRSKDVDAAVAAMHAHKGKVIHTSLPKELEESLQNELQQRIN
jgi:uncharacterized membrane protein